jgi:type III pantothenate kinase
MLLAVDSGNSLTKIGLFDEGKLIKIIQISAIDNIAQDLGTLNFDELIISTVNISRKSFQKTFSGNPIFFPDHNSILPFRLQYKTPETLGSDRLAAVAGAIKHHTDTNILVIQTGTCITYDLIDTDNVYQGGGISPGLEMRFKALEKFTGNLPLISFKENPGLIGRSTEEAIQSGVINGIIAEIQGIIDRYNENFEDLKVVITGGFANFFESKLKGSIFAIPNLVLWGLYSIYAINKSKD